VGRYFGFYYLVKHAELDYGSRDASSALSFPRSVTGFVNPGLAAFHATHLSRHSDGAALLWSNASIRPNEPALVHLCDFDTIALPLPLRVAPVLCSNRQFMVGLSTMVWRLWI